MVESMDDPNTPTLNFEITTDAQRKVWFDEDDNDRIAQVEKIYQLWWRWADFHLFIITPTVDAFSPPQIIQPEVITGTDEFEFVYAIHDHGYKLSASKGEDIFLAGLSMCKLYYTIEKMVYILVERLKSNGIDTEAAVEIAFDGHELAQRKCFDSIINLRYNVEVSNFHPGAWGERYLGSMERLKDMGYPYPPESPRDSYRKPHRTASVAKR